MAKRPPISRGEIDVARAVWELEKATVGEVHEHLTGRKSIDYATVQTYLRRLEQKGYLRTQRVGRNKLYLPKVSRRHVVGELIDDLLNQLFDGEPVALMQHLIRERGISSEETRTLRASLDKWIREQKSGGGDRDADR
jgi:predicted transcriptional regulator